MSAGRVILAGLLFLATVQSSYFFLVKCRVSLPEWVAFNACAIANLTFLVGFVMALAFHKPLVMFMAVLPLFFFGTGGLFVFPWKGFHLIAQASHILMTLNLSFIVLDIFRKQYFKTATLGLLLGIFVFSTFIAFQQNYVQRHMDALRKFTDYRPGALAGSDK